MRLDQVPTTLHMFHLQDGACLLWYFQALILAHSLLLSKIDVIPCPHALAAQHCTLYLTADLMRCQQTY